MAADLTPAHFAQFRTIEQALQAAAYAGIVGAGDALAEFDQLRRELESKPAHHWAETYIESESATYGDVLN